jgi:stringent starvation protein B
VSEVTTSLPSTKPYLIRAIYEWCVDGGMTPHLAVKVDDQTRVPMAYVKNGEIVLNIGVEAVHNLHLGNDFISCSGRFGGVAHELLIPVGGVIGIFARENGQGMAFEPQEPSPSSPPEGGGGEPPTPHGRPHLRVVK